MYLIVPNLSLTYFFHIQNYYYVVSIIVQLNQSELPVELCEKILEYVTYEGEIVLDSFAGSGAIGVAALNKKRSCILIEILKENIEKIKTRFNSDLYQAALE